MSRTTVQNILRGRGRNRALHQYVDAFVRGQMIPQHTRSWDGWHFDHDRLCSPQGFAFSAPELTDRGWQAQLQASRIADRERALARWEALTGLPTAELERVDAARWAAVRAILASSLPAEPPMQYEIALRAAEKARERRARR